MHCTSKQYIFSISVWYKIYYNNIIVPKQNPQMTAHNFSNIHCTKTSFQDIGKTHIQYVYYIIFLMIINIIILYYYLYFILIETPRRQSFCLCKYCTIWYSSSMTNTLNTTDCHHLKKINQQTWTLPQRQ